MKRWLLPIFLLLILASGWHWRQYLRERLLGDDSLRLTQAEIQEETARFTFRHEDDENAPARAQLRVRLQKIIRQQRLADATFQADITESFANERLAWWRQWEKDEDRQQRLRGQGLTELQMEENIQEALLDEAWIGQQIADSIKVSEAELKSAFEAQREHLKIPPVYRVAHLFLSRQAAPKQDRSAELLKIRERLMAGEAWESLVKTYSEDARSKSYAGELGWMSRQRMPDDFMSAVEKLKVGQTSQVVNTKLGWHLIRVLDKKAARMPRLEEVKKELAAQLVFKKREAAVKGLSERLLKIAPRSAL